jgi:hypothetical protein
MQKGRAPSGKLDKVGVMVGPDGNDLRNDLPSHRKNSLLSAGVHDGVGVGFKSMGVASAIVLRLNNLYAF